MLDAFTRVISQADTRGVYLTNDQFDAPVATPDRKQALIGASLTERGQLYRLRVTQAARGRAPQLRRSIKEYVVPYERLSGTLQKLNQRGCQILSIKNA